MKDVLAFLQGSGKGVSTSIFTLGILLVAVLLLVYFMNEGYADASGNKLDGSGNIVSLSLSDLIKALVFANQTGDTSDALKPPVFGSSTSVLPVTVAGGTLSSETEDRIAKNVAKNLKDEWLANRSTTPVLPANGSSCSSGSSDSCSSNSSPSCCQGADYNSNLAPYNSNDYIRKDSIPCYGCR